MLEALTTEPTWQMLLLGALSLSVGWGIRGNFGHEYGAAIPGALAAMAVILLSGRPDWWRRVHYFAMFGALGWSFGGSMSYMQVVAYTHSGRLTSVLYGYANLFVIGFLWAALGGAGTSLPAFLTWEQLTAFFTPLLAVFIAWSLQGFLVDLLFHVHPMRRHESRLYWYDTDWLACLTALGATLIVAGLRGGFDVATSFILYLCIGWFAAFLLLVNVLRLRMTPPRGDNWAGCVGMVAGLLLFCWRQGWDGVAFATLMTGLFGGLAFPTGQLLKLLFLRTGLQTNWHSVMEQTQGFLFGLGQAVVFALLMTRAPRLPLIAPLVPWTEVFAVLFVLVFLTYLNYRKATGTWVDQVESLTDRLYGLPVAGWLRWSRGFLGWFELIYIVIGIAVGSLLLAHLRHPLAFIPEGWLGKGQLLYLLFLWWVVVFNFERALVGFTPQRLVTEGVITFNAVLCTVLVALGPGGASVHPLDVGADFAYGNWIAQLAVGGAVALVSMVLVHTGLTRALHGTEPAPGAGWHIRFGPDATATKAKPRAGERHP